MLLRWYRARGHIWFAAQWKVVCEQGWYHSKGIAMEGSNMYDACGYHKYFGVWTALKMMNLRWYRARGHIWFAAQWKVVCEQGWYHSKGIAMEGSNMYDACGYHKYFGVWTALKMMNLRWYRARGHIWFVAQWKVVFEQGWYHVKGIAMEGPNIHDA